MEMRGKSNKEYDEIGNLKIYRFSLIIFPDVLFCMEQTKRIQFL
jgi:hypothetical protein